jgi:lipopolysaccharide export system protein LptA
VGAAAALSALAVFVVKTGRTRDVAGPGRSDSSSRIEGFTFEEFSGERKVLSVTAGVGTFDDDGSFSVQDVRRVEIHREGKPPLIARAERGAGTGPQGERVVRLEGGVEVFDAEAGVRAALDSLEVDQRSGVARSLGEVSLESGTMTGKADAVIYGLGERPTEIFVLALQGGGGSALAASHAVVEPGERRLDLTGAVRVTNGRATLRSERVVLLRAPDGRPERAEISLGLVLDVGLEKGEPLRATAEAGEVTWSTDGEIASALLEGHARLRQAATEIDAQRIGADRLPDAGWDLRAEGSVRARGMTRDGDALLEALRLDARTDEAGAIERADAIGAVRFRSDRAVAESEKASFRPEEREFPIVLEGPAGARARVASGRTRVAAGVIRTDAQGTRLAARDRVEASLLPETDAAAKAEAPGPFRADEAVHFVSRELDSAEAGRVLAFRGEVKGWQGDRHLSADEVEIDDRQESLRARGSVLTRFPDPGREAGQPGFVQVTAANLDYRGEPGAALYEGSVRVRQREGWLESERLEIDLGGEPRMEIREIRASGSVRFEYRAVEPETDTPPARGSADRLRHDPIARVLRLMGDRAPAEIRRPGDAGGSTRGRVLRYDLNSGAVDVESGTEERPR